MTSDAGSGGSGGSNPHKIGRLRGINGRLAKRLEGMDDGELPLLPRMVLIRVALDTDDDGRGWIDLARLSRFCAGRSLKTCMDALEAASNVPGLVYYVDPGRKAKLPWTDARSPTPGAIGVWVPDAALALDARRAHRRCAESLSAHKAAFGEAFPVKGVGLDNFLKIACAIATDDAASDAADSAPIATPAATG